VAGRRLRTVVGAEGQGTDQVGKPLN